VLVSRGARQAARAVLAVSPVVVALVRMPVNRLAVDLLGRAIKMLHVLNAASFTLASLRARLTATTCLLTWRCTACTLPARAGPSLFPDDAKTSAGGSESDRVLYPKRGRW